MRLPSMLCLALFLLAAAPAARAAADCGTGIPYVFRAGVADELAAPADPTFRGPALSAAFPAAVWKDFDDRTANRLVGQTFLGLPAGIVRAELELRMMPHADVPGNDAVELGLTPSGGFAAVFPIASLEEADGTWDPRRNGLTTFKIALGQPYASLFAQMSAQGRLDVVVEDDTAVDAMTLRVWACPSPLFPDGLPELAAGDAAVSLQPDGTTIVTNPKPTSGGLSLFPPGSEGVCLALSQPICMPVGTAMDLAACGMIANDPRENPAKNHLFFTYNPSTGNVDITADFAPYNTSCSRVTVYHGTGATTDCIKRPGVLASLPPGTCITEVDWVRWASLKQGFCLLLGPPAPVTIPTQGTFTSGKVCFAPDVIVGTENHFLLSRFDVQTQGIPSFAVGAQLVQSGGLLHRALGGASFQTVPQGVSVVLPSASGADGVAVDLATSGSAEAHFAPLDPRGFAPDGAFLQADWKGTLSGASGVSLGTLKATHKVQADFDELVLAPDFSARGAASFRLEVDRGGATVLSAGRQTGPAVRRGNVVVIWPAALTLRQDGGLEVRWTTAAPIALPDGTTANGDVLRILPETGAAVRTDNLTGLELRAAGLAEITLTGAATTSCLPAITRQPADVATAAGRPAVFTVGVESASPVTYRWRRDGSDLADDARVSGAASATLTLAPTILSQAGSYDVVVTNACGTVESAAATYLPPVALRTLLLALVRDVQALAAQGTLSAAQEAGLSASLVNALRFLHDGNLPGTANRVDIFLSRVATFIRAGALSASQGEALTSAARDVRARLQ